MTAAGTQTVALVSASRGYSGAERCLTPIIELLQPDWRFVALISDRADPELGRRLAAAGADVHVVPGLRRTPTPHGAVALTRALRRLHPAVVHVNATDQRDALGALAIAAAGRAPAVATVHLVLPRRARWRERLAIAALGRMAAVIAVSEGSAVALRERGITPTVVRNGLRPAALDADARAVLGLRDEDLVIGGIGRLDVQKGWDVLVRAAGTVTSVHPRAVFVVVGDGPERAALEQAGGDVRFTGPVPDAARLLGAFDVLAMPSRYEGLPLVAIEAMHAGVPIVATPVGGVPELVGEDAVLVPVDDDGALAAALLELAGDPERRRRLGESARRRAGEHFTDERMAAEIGAVYAAVTSRTSAISRSV
jgi:glycosyltransferase involved in cell wall biosynthesis